MSTYLNTVAGTIYEDFIGPSLTKKPTEVQASRIIKLLVVVFGTICATMVLVVEKLGALIEMTNSFGGLTSGSILGLFLLGMFFPSANAKGAMWGSISSLSIMFFMLAGNRIKTAQGLINHPVLPLSIDGCNATFISKPMNPQESLIESDHVFFLYKVSVFYYGLIGCVIVIIVGFTVSYITGPNKIENIHPDLLSPLLHRYIPEKIKKTYVLSLKEKNKDIEK